MTMKKTGRKIIILLMVCTILGVSGCSKATAENPAGETAISGDTISSNSISPQTECVFGPLAEAGLEDHVMDWQDENLEAAMREITGISDRDIMLSDVWEITDLDLQLEDIHSIDALWELKNLQQLDLSSNPINNIDVLCGLTNLQQLDLSNIEVNDIDSLSGLTDLQILYLYSCQIGDISALRNLTNLIELNR